MFKNSKQDVVAAWEAYEQAASQARKVYQQAIAPAWEAYEQAL